MVVPTCRDSVPCQRHKALQKYIAKRLLLAIPAILGVSIVIFTMMRVIPGDPLGSYFNIEDIYRLSEEEKALIMHDLGLDRPYVLQYADWMKNLLTGSLGDSLFRKDDILAVIGRRLPISAEIGVLSVLLAWVMGLPVGILSALRPQSASDAAASSFTVLFLAIPNFWFGMVIVLASISWFGYKSPIVSVQLWDDPWRNFQIIAGPTVVLGTGLAAVIARLARSSLMEILRDDYVRTARAKGLRERLIMVRHTLPNALLPVLTVTGLMLATVIGGSVAVEQAFTAPGLGKTLVAAMTDRDFNIVQNIVLIYCLIFVVMNLIVDILYGYLDPRIRFAE